MVVAAVQHIIPHAVGGAAGGRGLGWPAAPLQLPLCWLMGRSLLAAGGSLGMPPLGATTHDTLAEAVRQHTHCHPHMDA